MLKFVFHRCNISLTKTCVSIRAIHMVTVFSQSTCMSTYQWTAVLGQLFERFTHWELVMHICAGDFATIDSSMICLFGVEPFLEPALIHSKLHTWEQSSVKFLSKCNIFLSGKCIWKCCLQHVDHYSGHNALNCFRITLCFAISHHIKMGIFPSGWIFLWCFYIRKTKISTSKWPGMKMTSWLHTLRVIIWRRVERRNFRKVTFTKDDMATLHIHIKVQTICIILGMYCTCETANHTLRHVPCICKGQYILNTVTHHGNKSIVIWRWPNIE